MQTQLFFNPVPPRDRLAPLAELKVPNQEARSLKARRYLEKYYIGTAAEQAKLVLFSSTGL